MTKEKILSYLDREDISKSKDEKLTRMYFGKHIMLVNFLKRDQIAELMEKNNWIIYSLDNLVDAIIIYGDNITKFKSGRLDPL